jgi:acyl carrier protein
MPTTDITQEEVLAVYPKIAQIMAEALGCDVEDVGLNVPLIEGLNAESIDFLDIVFGLERAFKVKIPRGKIVEDARGDLPEAAFEEKGYLTEVGLTRLREYLSEVPADCFRSPMRVSDIPRLFTPETFCKIVARGLRNGAGDSSESSTDV